MTHLYARRVPADTIHILRTVGGAHVTIVTVSAIATVVIINVLPLDQIQILLYFINVDAG